MYVGHYAPALLAKASVRELPLWSLFLAAQALDFLFDGLALAGVERVALIPGERGPLAMDLQWMPYSHSLLAAVGFGATAAIAGAVAGRARAGITIGLVIASHWVLDAVVHRPDLHLGLGAEPRLGLGLWAWPLLALIVEVGIVVLAGRVLYQTMDRGRGSLVRLVAAMCVVQAVVAFAPPAGTISVLLVVTLASYGAWTFAAASIDRAQAGR